MEFAALAKREELLYRPGQLVPIALERGSESLYFVQRIRDEAHRFAITFHRSKRGKSMVASSLSGVEGLGPARRERLLGAFGSLNALRQATLERARRRCAWLPERRRDQALRSFAGADRAATRPRGATMSEVLLVTGMSGAGRSTVAAALEDIGWFVIDNMPIELVSRAWVNWRSAGSHEYAGVAFIVGRSGGVQPEALLEVARGLAPNPRERQDPLPRRARRRPDPPLRGQPVVATPWMRRRWPSPSPASAPCSRRSVTRRPSSSIPGRSTPTNCAGASSRSFTDVAAMESLRVSLGLLWLLQRASRVTSTSSLTVGSCPTPLDR